MSRFVLWFPPVALTILLAACPAAQGQAIRLVDRKPDPHAAPRPYRDAQNVPLRTSVYLEIQAADKAHAVDPEQLTIGLFRNGKPVARLLDSGRKFVAPATGWIFARPASGGLTGKPVDQWIVYIEPGVSLEAETKYEVQVRTSPTDQAGPPAARWSFTTEAAPGVRPLDMRLDLAQPPVEWQGRFFSGLCNVVFCTPNEQFGPTYALMDQAWQKHPRAWSYQRDFWMTGFEYRKPGLLAQRLPNIVRELETRRIVSVEPHDRGTLLKVEDFFGHEQYGIESNRPLSGDYHEGDEVLIADGVSDAKAKVIAVDDNARTVLVSKVEAPKDGWQTEYQGPLPTKEDPDAPGLFPPGGCYLRKFAPHGTPVYYWGRLDKEWDLLHRKHGRRLFVNFADAPGDLSRDGRSWTTVKDYAQWHAVAKEMAGHVIDRYGDESLTFTWSVFNEPDLGPLFWRCSWEELQQFYDYTTDAILRAFEDRGYDSQQVFVGGLELGGIFGTHLRLQEFLAHCSPTAEAKGALAENAAFADARLDGKRSKRVETLCKSHGGKGAPCDFVSIHAYNNSAMMAAKLKRAKDMALEIDPKFFADLWVNSHEACPEWSLPPDEAAGDSYLGNGYFPTWCFDVAARQLEQGAKDARYARGETLLTVWPPPAGLTGINAITRIVNCDDDGDGRADRAVTLAYPVFHALNLLSDFGDHYWPLQRQKVEGHEVSGFASRADGGVLRVALLAHQSEDTQSRSEAQFAVKLSIADPSLKHGEQLKVTEHRFDRQHNSYFDLARGIRAREQQEKVDRSAIDTTLKRLSSGDVQDQLDAIAEIANRSTAEQFAVLTGVAALAESAEQQKVRDAAKQLIDKLIFAASRGRPGLPRADVERLQRLSELQKPEMEMKLVDKEGQLDIEVQISGNGLSVLTIEPSK